MSLTLGLGVAVGVAPSASAPPESNPNLLLWTEVFDNALWTAGGGVAVIANATAAPDATLTADRYSSAVLNGALGQSSATAATTGAAATLDYVLTGGWSRQAVSGVFDGLDYTFSIYLVGGDVGSTIRLQLDRSGGVLRVQVIDREDGIVAFLWGAQLEQAAAPTAYQKREGT